MLPAWKLFADHIVVADQMSHDGTREFLASHDAVHIVDNPDKEYNEKRRIELLVEKARGISTGSVLLFLDADETLSANVLKSLEWTTFRNSSPGTAGFFSWVQLWGSVRRYVARGPVSAPVHMPFAFVDDGRDLDGLATMHGFRGPGLAKPSRRFIFNDVVLLHFFLTNREVYKKKQNWYKLYWLKRGGTYFHINRNHTSSDAIDVANINPAPSAWVEGFERHGLDLSSVSSPELLWYDVEILQYIKEVGEKRLWLLDIWNQDWEHLRQLALSQGHTGIPDRPIRPPPGWIGRYNDWTLGRTNLAAKGRSLGRFVKRKVLP